MKFTYDAETDSLYIDVLDRPSVEAEEIAPGVVADFDSNGTLVGLDVEHASRTFDLSLFEFSGLPHLLMKGEAPEQPHARPPAVPRRQTAR